MIAEKKKPNDHWVFEGHFAEILKHKITVNNDNDNDKNNKDNNNNNDNDNNNNNHNNNNNNNNNNDNTVTDHSATMNGRKKKLNESLTEINWKYDEFQVIVQIQTKGLLKIKQKVKGVDIKFKKI